jgi:tRNA (guanine37-N1)-methyltransferase
MWYGIISLFNDMFQALEYGVMGRALSAQRITMAYWNPRDFSDDKHQTVDDKPYGGGPGMVMRSAPLTAAIDCAKAQAPHPATVIYLSPQGRVFKQQHIPQLLAKKALIFVAGRYEGIDQRIIDQVIDEEWSIGDYILSGGELATMVMIDALTRHIPGVVGDCQSVATDSLSTGLLKYPQYTRPETINGQTVPEVLLSGNHQQIDHWRRKQSLGQTWLKRPDLLQNKNLSPEEQKLLNEFITELRKDSK